MFSVLVLLLGLGSAALGAEECTNLDINSVWDEGLDATLFFNLDHDTEGSWDVHLTFDKELTQLECWQTVVSTTDHKTFTLHNLDWDGDYDDGYRLPLHFLAHFTSRSYLIAADIDGQDVCEGGSAPTTTEKTTTRTTPTPKPTTSTEKPDTTTTAQESNCDDIISVVEDDGTQTSLDLAITPTEDLTSWSVVLTFASDVDDVSSPLADVSGSGSQWTLSSKSWDGNLPAGETFDLNFFVNHGGNGYPGLMSITLNGDEQCGGSNPTPPTDQPSGNCEDITDAVNNGDNSDLTLSITPSTDITQWVVVVEFDIDVDSVSSPLAAVTGSGKTWELESKSWDGTINAGDTFELSLNVVHSTGAPTVAKATINGEDLCQGATTVTSTFTPYPPTTTAQESNCNDIINIVEDDGTQTSLDLAITPTEDLTSWSVVLTFSSSVDSVSSPLADASGSGSQWTLSSKSWDGNLPAGETFDLNFFVNHGGNGYPGLMSITLNGDELCGGSNPTPPTDQPSGNCEDITDAVNNGDNSDMTLSITPSTDITQWVVIVEFNIDVDSVSSPLAAVTGSGKTWELESKSWDGTINAGDTFELSLNVVHSTGAPTVAKATINGEDLCQGATTVTSTFTPYPPTTTASNIYHPDHPAKYPYAEVIEKSLLFYEAQRSGPLPANKRIDWRGDSSLNDAVPGGYHDAGDHVKFGFPMASFTTVLAWGGINFKAGYDKAGQTEYLRDCLKWSTDYFIGCHTSDNEFIGQIGDGYADHGFWGRPEEMTMNRPAFKITASQPGSELAGETAAALAASSIFFRSIGDNSYADECLAHAKTLFKFADEHRGFYTDAIPAADFYNDWGGYNDELAWAAVWVAKATNDPADIAKAESMYQEVGMAGAEPSEISWDDKNAMVFLSMYELTGKSEYKTKAESFLNFVLTTDRTPQGLVWIGSSEWGSLRHAGNLAMYAAQAIYNGLQPDSAFDFVEKQINYILGDTGMSYVVGFGNNPPQRCHHRAASCEDRPANCDWADKDKSGPNGQVLNGALVGGPDRNDNWNDDRNNFQTNEVATDYNAGFQTAVAALNAMFD